MDTKDEMRTTSKYDETTPEPNDNWIHRAEGLQCHTCMWFVSKTKENGRCRKRSPTLGGWPVVFPTDWCGDHKLV